MRTTQRYQILRPKTRPDPFGDFIADLGVAPLVWSRCRGSGAVEINYGSVATTIAVGGTTPGGRVGPLGPGEARLYDGATSYQLVADHASLNGLGTLTLVCLANFSSAGESSAGRMFHKNSSCSLSFLSGRVRFVNDYSTTSAEARSNEDIPLNQPVLLVGRIDTLVPTVFINGAEVTYSLQTSAVGDPVSNTNPWHLGNNHLFALTCAGRMDEFLIFGAALTDEQIEDMWDALP